MKKIIFILIHCVSLFALASGGGGGSSGGGGGASSGGGTTNGGEGVINRSSLSQPTMVNESRKRLHKRMQGKEALSGAPTQTAIKKIKADASGIDHSHAALTRILSSTVVMKNNGQKSLVNYASINSESLNRYINQLLSASKTQVFSVYTKDQRLAYFINLYNAVTLQLIKKNYGKIKSIKKLRKGLTGPWDQKLVTLFGKPTSLNDIEHGYIRGQKGYVGRAKKFDDPRIHFAVNCASIGCPALLNKAFTADNLEVDLEKATINFLKDHSRNGFDSDKKTWGHSSIFKWYKGDFEKGLKGYTSLKKFAQKYADAIAKNPQEKALILSGDFKMKARSYDWNLNDKI